jgi:hypothetical protein
LAPGCAEGQRFYAESDAKKAGTLDFSGVFGLILNEYENGMPGRI